MDDAIEIIDVHGRFYDVNRAGYESLGYTREEMLRISVPDIEMKVTRAELEKSLRETSITAPPFTVHGMHRRKDGTTFPVEIRVKCFEHERRKMFIAAVRDVSERVKAEKRLEAANEQLRQSQKMEAIGQLASGIAHDFNNIITAINGNVHLLLAEIPEGDPKRADLNDIRDAADRAAALTAQLLAFSRRQPFTPEIIDMNAAVSDMERMIRRIIGEGVRLILALDPQPCIVKADRMQMGQVLLNLAVNARDAMPQGGTLTIRTSRLEVSAEDAHTRMYAYPEPGIPRNTDVGRLGGGGAVKMAVRRHVKMTVADTGHGMDKATCERIFEPFFTTKPRGKGTGLGLSTVFGIVNQNGGSIVVESDPDRGAEFSVLLPEASAPSPA